MEDQLSRLLSVSAANGLQPPSHERNEQIIYGRWMYSYISLTFQAGTMATASIRMRYDLAVAAAAEAPLVTGRRTSATLRLPGKRKAIFLFNTFVLFLFTSYTKDGLEISAEQFSYTQGPTEKTNPRLSAHIKKRRISESRNSIWMWRYSGYDAMWSMRT